MGSLVAGLRREDEVCEHAARVCLLNALRTGEGALLRELNRDKAALGAMCERMAGVRVEGACAVGVDPHGIDVRARFGIVRAEFPAELCASEGITCCERAGAAIRSLMGSGGGA